MSYDKLINRIYKVKPLDYIEKIYYDKVARKVLNIEYESLPHMTINEFELKELTKQIYCLGYAVDMYKLKRGIVENHIYKEWYTKLYEPNDIDLYIENTWHYLMCEINPTTYCIKMILFNQKDIINKSKETILSNIKLEKSFKEVYFGYVITQLVLNKICYGFPMMIEYFTSEMNKDFVTNVEKLSKNTHALNLVMEYVGRTIKDMVYLMQKEVYKVAYGDLFGEMRMFKKICFEMLYNIYCMNKYCGIVHTDLHVNNATMMAHTQLNYMPSLNIYRGCNHIMYSFENPSTPIKVGQFKPETRSREEIHEFLLSDRTLNRCEYNYVLPFYNGYLAIIDFSRSFQHKDKILDIINPKSKKNLIMLQNLRMAKLLDVEKLDVYNYYMNNDEVYDYMFNTIAAFDVQYFFDQLSQLVSFNKEMSDFARKLSNNAKSFIEKRLKSITIKNVDKFKNNKDNIAFDLLVENFAEFKEGAVKECKKPEGVAVDGLSSKDPGYHYNNALRGQYDFRIEYSCSMNNEYVVMPIYENPVRIEHFNSLKLNSEIEQDEEFEIDLDLSNLLTG
jgi:hypothetical protein